MTKWIHIGNWYIESSEKERKAKRLPVAITEEEFANVVKHTKMMKHKVAFLLAFGSGLRVSEIIKLCPEEINIKEKKILIIQGKGRKDRVVPLPKGFKEEHLKFFPMEYNNLKSGVRSLEKSFKSSCCASGLTKTKPTIHFHSLRHGFGSRAAKMGIPIHHIRTLMGHANIATTNVYLELNPQEALKSYEENF